MIRHPAQTMLKRAKRFLDNNPLAFKTKPKEFIKAKSVLIAWDRLNGIK